MVQFHLAHVGAVAFCFLSLIISNILHAQSSRPGVGCCLQTCRSLAAQISSGACLVVSFASMMKSSSFYMMGGGRIDEEIPYVLGLPHDIYSIALPMFKSVRN